MRTAAPPLKHGLIRRNESCNATGTRCVPSRRDFRARLASSAQQVALILLYLIVALPAWGQVPIEEVRSISPTLWCAASGGIWEQGGRHGLYRVIVLGGGAEHTRTFVYAQWITFDESSGQLREAVTEPVESLNKDFSRTVRSVQLDGGSRPGNARFALVLQPRESDQLQTATLVLGEPGQVSLTLP